MGVGRPQRAVQGPEGSVKTPSVLENKQRMGKIKCRRLHGLGWGIFKTRGDGCCRNQSIEGQGRPRMRIATNLELWANLQHCGVEMMLCSEAPIPDKRPESQNFADKCRTLVAIRSQGNGSIRE